MNLTPGCYIDSHNGHYAIPGLIEFAYSYGFPLDPFAKFTMGVYGDHYHTDDYPTGAMDELADNAEAWLNDNHKYEGHVWTWNDGDFGLYPQEDED